MRKILAFGLFLSLVCFANAAANKVSKTKSPATSQTITLYQSQFCGCCGSWVKYMENLGYKFDIIKDSTKMMATKSAFKVKDEYQSCHTGVVEGFVIEGHVPEDAVAWLLRERPKDIIGVSTPGMPLGSPGMEQGSEKEWDEYPVILMLKDGGYRIFGTYKGKNLLKKGE